jgi:hypothetical protein
LVPFQFGVPVGDGQCPASPFGGDASGLHLGHVGAEVDLGLSLDALSLQAPVINPRFQTRPLQGEVGAFGPFLPPGLKQFLLVPVPVLPHEAPWGNVPGGEQDVGVGVLALLLVKRHIRDHAASHELLFHESPNQFFPVVKGQFLGKGNLNLAGYLGIFSFFGTFDFVP